MGSDTLSMSFLALLLYFLPDSKQEGVLLFIGHLAAGVYAFPLLEVSEVAISRLGLLPFHYLNHNGEEDGEDQQQSRAVDADHVLGVYPVGTALHFYLNLSLFNHFSFF